MIVPNELLNRNIWVCRADYQRADGAVKKIPINPRTGQAANCNDANTWTDYRTAERAMWHGGYKGLGFALGNGICGIDLDRVFDYKLEPWAREIVNKANSYAEYSPSGSGVHIIAKADLPASRRIGQIELYTGQRFFSFTGRHFEGAPLDVQPRQQEFSELYSKLFPAMRPAHVIARVSGPTRTNDEVLQLASDNPRFNALFYDGDLSMWGGNASNADMALANILARYTNGNLDQMRELFKESAIYQMPGRAEKFSRARRDSSYGEITLRKALECPQVSVGERSGMGMRR